MQSMHDKLDTRPLDTAPFDDGAYDLVAPQSAEVPLLIDSPHSGRCYPDDFETRVTHTVLRGAEDWMVDDLFAGAPLEGATLLAARFPRAYIDANRRLDDVDPALIDGTWPTPLRPGPKSAPGLGLFPPPPAASAGSATAPTTAARCLPHPCRSTVYAAASSIAGSLTERCWKRPSTACTPAMARSGTSTCTP